MSMKQDKTTYLHMMRAAVETTHFETLVRFDEKLDHLLKSVYLAMETRREHLDALACCPGHAHKRKEQLMQLVSKVDERIQQLTARTHALALEAFRLPFHNDQVLNAACEEFAWEKIAKST